MKVMETFLSTRSFPLNISPSGFPEKLLSTDCLIPEKNTCIQIFTYIVSKSTKTFYALALMTVIQLKKTKLTTL